MRRFQHPTLGAALLCCGLSLSGWAQQSPEPAPQPAAAPARTSVGVARLDTVWIQPEREAPAQVIARNESKLSAEVSGTLLRWTADVGAQVARGQVLAQIDPRDAELAVQRAQAALDATQARLRGLQVLDQRFAAQPLISTRLKQVTTTWNYIEKSLLNYKEKSVPFVVVRYSDKIVAGLTAGERVEAAR